MKFLIPFVSVILLASCGNSDDPKALKLMAEGNRYMDARNFNSAMIRFKEAANLELSDESRSKNYRNIAVTFLYLEEPDSAKKYSKLGFECLESYSYYHLINMAEYELLSKETDKAIKTFEEAKKLKPNEMEVYNNLSLIYAGNYGESFEDLPKALSNAQKAFDLNPNPVNQEQLASVFFQMEKYEKAAEIFHDLGEKYPAVLLYRFYEGQSLYFDGKENEGLELMENAADRDEHCRELFEALVS